MVYFDLARWDAPSNRWLPINSCCGDPGASVLALAWDGHNFVVGGTYLWRNDYYLDHAINMWNGISWGRLGGYFMDKDDYGSVYTLAVYKGRLIAGADFDAVSINGTRMPARYLAEFHESSKPGASLTMAWTTLWKR